MVYKESFYNVVTLRWEVARRVALRRDFDWMVGLSVNSFRSIQFISSLFVHSRPVGTAQLFGISMGGFTQNEAYPWPTKPALDPFIERGELYSQLPVRKTSVWGQCSQDGGEQSHCQPDNEILLV